LIDAFQFVAGSQQQFVLSNYDFGFNESYGLEHTPGCVRLQGSSSIFSSGRSSRALAAASIA
jgi:hypothetical protein